MFAQIVTTTSTSANPPPPPTQHFGPANPTVLKRPSNATHYPVQPTQRPVLLSTLSLLESQNDNFALCNFGTHPYWSSNEHCGLSGQQRSGSWHHGQHLPPARRIQHTTWARRRPTLGNVEINMQEVDFWTLPWLVSTITKFKTLGLFETIFALFQGV